MFILDDLLPTFIAYAGSSVPFIQLVESAGHESSCQRLEINIIPVINCTY